MPAHLETRTVRETRPSSTLRRPALVWGAIVAYLAAVTLLVSTVLPVDFVDRSQAGFFEPQGFAAMVVFGSIGVFLSTRTGFPDPIGPETPLRIRFMVPMLIGIGGGALFLTTDVVTGLSRLNAETFAVPSTDIDFPASVLVYSAAAGYVEIVFRLLPVPLFIWLTSSLILRGRGRTPVFWVLAVLTSMLEPLSQVGTRVLPPVPFLFVLMQSFGINMAQAITFRRHGFLAAIIVRVAFYVVYHVVGAPLK